jgi:hypothetical protein
MSTPRFVILHSTITIYSKLSEFILLSIFSQPTPKRLTVLVDIFQSNVQQ